MRLPTLARQLVTFNGMMDEQFLQGLADKVHRGQEGRVLKGLNPGGKLYGYVNVPILNPSRPGKYGHPAVDGVYQEINATQAAVVVRIFRMYAAGMGLALISKTLNAERVLAPQPPRRDQSKRGVHLRFGKCCETNFTAACASGIGL